MPAHSELAAGLKGTLAGALSDRPDNNHLNRLIEICHSLAFAAVCAKSARGRLYQEVSTNLSDLAFDCIAELFQRDEEGNLVRIRTYFESFDVRHATDPDLLAHLRRLVFSAVNQSLFRIYNDLDPSFGKILRNIKLAIQSLGNFRETERLGEPCIAPILCDPLEHLPLMEWDRLQTELAGMALGTEKIPELLAKLALLLRRQSEYARLIPLTTLARAVKGLYALKQIGPASATEEQHGAIHHDVATACRWASSIVRTKAEKKYVGKKKISQEILGKYLEAVDEYLAGKLNGGLKDLSLYESVIRVFPGMKRGAYNRVHRSRVDYLARQVEKLALDRLRKS